MTFRVQWAPKALDRWLNLAPRFTDRKNAEQMARELDVRYPDIRHRVVEE